jgi:hypothetical protein
VLAGGRALDPQGTSRVGPWPDGTVYLSARTATEGHRDYPGLGWQVVVRQRADRALASVAALCAGILATGSGVALAAALLAWLLAGLIARPDRPAPGGAGGGRRGAGPGPPLPPLPRSLVREGAMIAEALDGAADELARRAEAHRLLVDELNHRVKNTLATVQAMAAQSLKNLGAGAAAGRDAFEARLPALSRADDILTRQSWASADLRGIADHAVRPFLDAEAPAEAPRITLDGPDLRLPPEGALALTMILHELCTSAVKHGALSVPGGAGLDRGVRPGRPPPPDDLARARRPPGGAPVAEGVRHPPAGAGLRRRRDRHPRLRGGGPRRRGGQPPPRRRLRGGRPAPAGRPGLIPVAARPAPRPGRGPPGRAAGRAGTCL